MTTISPKEMEKLARQMQFISDQAQQVRDKLARMEAERWGEWVKVWEDISVDTGWYVQEIKNGNFGTQIDQSKPKTRPSPEPFEAG